MLIYVESKAFPNKTFTLICNPHDTIARARAQMLHILYELGREEHQFRFRFKGEYLRDAYTLDDYKILDNSVIKMVPMSKRKRGSYANLHGSRNSGIDDEHDFSSKANLPAGHHELDDVQKALYKEIAIFTKREKLLTDFKVLLWIHFLAAVLSLTTTYRYAASWSGLLMIFGFAYCPNYTRLGGFVGKYGMNKKHFMIFFSVGAIMNLTASLLMGIYLIFELLAFVCDNQDPSCLRQKELMWWSIILYLTQAVALAASIFISIMLIFNFNYEVGNIIEKFLIQTRDIDKVMNSAKLGNTKERRHAAFELASLAALGDETKFRIVGEGGLESLMNLCLSDDIATQEYAAEAVSELLTIPAIQDQFVELGGVRTLCALLHSKDKRVVNEAVTALSYIVADSEANRQTLLNENGMDDLFYIAERVHVPASRIVSAIFLELAFSAEIRIMMSAQQASVSALEKLCRSRDDETQRLSLQTLELLAIENSDTIIGHDGLLDYLLFLPSTSDDEQLYLLASKILLYYAENESACQKLVDFPDLKNCLTDFAVSNDPLLQNIVAKIILAMLDSHENKDAIASLGLDEVLMFIKSDATDRDAWEMSDHGLTILHNIRPKLHKDDSNTSVESITGKKDV
ncbi:uncharacterized protein LOC5511221 [Nematostella vectensis]|uniref:uncharacterized protein LOC5511221 n=1 Tax=Nematostella vectensis TaxID=45351 RepID=UPI00138FEDD7|nr:uncharacterized protein LOC5511221 [Nematostella vectensis]